MELCQHTATVRRYAELEGDDFIIVGGYESGVDAAYHLAHQGKRCKILDKGSPWKNEGSDPSVCALDLFLGADASVGVQRTGGIIPECGRDLCGQRW